MNILTSSAHFRQRVIKKSYKIGVTEASKCNIVLMKRDFTRK